MSPTTPPPERDAWISQIVTWNNQEADEEIRRGLPIDLVLRLQELLELTDEEAASVIGRSRSTYSRYRSNNKVLGVPEGERAVRYTRLVGLASETFGSLDEARAWMLESNYALGDEAPIEVAQTDPGADIVRDLLEGMQRGFPL